MSGAVTRLADAAERLAAIAEQERRERQRAEDDRTVANYGRRNRATPHQLGFLTFCRAIPGYLAQFQPIPERYWTRERELAVVSCPCEETVRLAMDAVEGCQSCERVYARTARDVRVANSPKAGAG